MSELATVHEREIIDLLIKIERKLDKLLRLQPYKEVDLSEEPNHIVGPSELEVTGPKDLLGPVPDKPSGRTGIDKELTDLIDYFRMHPGRVTTYIPPWGKAKKQLRPYVEAKGSARVREMLDAFVRRYEWGWNTTDPNDRQYFNAKCVFGTPLTIQGFVTIAARLDELLIWETPELPYV